jgi:agmatine deiminase
MPDEMMRAAVFALALTTLACGPVDAMDEQEAGSSSSDTEGVGETSGSEVDGSDTSATGSDADTETTGGSDNGTESDAESGDDGSTSMRRVPAEWEEQGGVWLQWPQSWESHFEPAFVEIVRHVGMHQEVHLLANDNGIQQGGEQALSAAGVDTANVSWHVVANDSAWMRDNGPRYVYEGDQLIVQNWAFDAWGGNFGPGIPFAADNAVPIAVADILGLPIENYDLVHERGDLEFNGEDTLIVSWSVLSDRNPGLTKTEADAIFVDAFGVDSVVYIEGFHPEDGTTGHVDGFSRFISADEVVVGQVEDPLSDPLMAGLFDDVADQISEQRPDLTLTRMPFPADTDYMNWLVGNGYVISGAFGDADVDAAAKALIESYFPGRAVYMVDVTAMWADGGGIHCVTNDQPM